MFDEELIKYFEGMGWKFYFVFVYVGGEFDGFKEYMEVYEEMVKVMDVVVEDILVI